MSRYCRCKEAFVHGQRPHPQARRNAASVCRRACIFCDIWKLSTLVFSHIPLAARNYSYATHKLQVLSGASPSTSSTTAAAWAAKERSIEARFQTQRVRLASIMSICTVDGAEESEGLQMAYDRCLESVSDLLYEERLLEEKVLRTGWMAHVSMQQPTMGSVGQRRTSQDCGSSYSAIEDSRSSMVGAAR